MIDTSKELINRVIEESNESTLRGHEIWTVKNNELIDSTYSLCDPVKLDQYNFAIGNFDELPEDVLEPFNEFTYQITNAISLASYYMPNHLKVYQRLSKAVNHVLEELLYLHYPEKYNEDFNYKDQSNYSPFLSQGV